MIISMIKKKVYLSDNFCTVYKLIFHKISKYLEANNYEIIDCMEKADIAIVGLCAAFEADEKKSSDLIGEVCSKVGIKVYAYGCYTKVREDIFNCYPNVRYFYMWQLNDMLEEVTGKNSDGFKYIKMPCDFRTKNDYRIPDTNQKFVLLTTGCSFSCTYCPHKLGAGSLQSRDETDILRQIDELNVEKVPTIFLTGIDTAAYGIDNGKKFSHLVKKILERLDKHITIRISQFNPEGINYDFDEMVEICSDERIIDFQLPLQTSSKRLLNLMGRNYSPEKISKFIKLVKSRNKNIRFRTDLLIGFPTETFEETKQSVLYAIEHYDEIIAYTFELKEGTPISKMNLAYHTEEEKEKRRMYVYEKVKKAGKIVQSGAQNYATLFESDIRKYKEDVIKYEEQRCK